MAVKVYGSIRAVCPQRVIACLLEKEVEFEIVHVELDAGEQKKPAFLQRQPFGQVPAVEDGDFRLFESRAIIRYYATKYTNHGADLLGATPEERAVVDQWLEVEAHNFNESAFNLAFQLVISPHLGLRSDLALVHSSEQKLEKVLDVYEQRLSKSKYLAGDFFSLADLSHLPALRCLTEDAGLGHLVKEREFVNAWWEDISSRPSWKKLLTLL
ncbi:hypothetical protein BT93_H0722 [Corymbia citriodora subsp. variegata]|nr:hypothetical protein BT93_H0722 [Corymbia citriodora subsp. variegata]